MSKIITVKQALEQGYSLFSYGDKNEYQHLYSIEHANDGDFESGPLYVAHKEPYYVPQISNEEISETLADLMSDQNHCETGDDTDDVYDIVKGLDYSLIAEAINAALANKKCYKITNIQLIK